MAVAIVESTRPVTGGVDTHLDTHVAAAMDASGAVLGVESFPARATTWVSPSGWDITPAFTTDDCGLPSGRSVLSTHRP
jgi:hypothetical protein